MHVTDSRLPHEQVPRTQADFQNPGFQSYFLPLPSSTIHPIGSFRSTYPYRQSLTHNQLTVSTSTMASQLEICNKLFARVPFLSNNQLRILFQLDKGLTAAGLRSDLSLAAGQQIHSANEVSATRKAEYIPSIAERWQCPHQGNKGCNCLTCKYQAQRKEQWEQLFERYKAAKREPVVANDIRQQPLDDCPFGNQSLQDGDIAGTWEPNSETQTTRIPPHHRNRAQKVALETLAGNNVAEVPTEPDQVLSQACKEAASQPRTQIVSSRVHSNSVSPRRNQTDEDTTTLKSGSVAPPISPNHFPKRRLSRTDDQCIVPWPGLQTLSQYTIIQFPETSYFLNDNMRSCALQSQTSMDKIGKSQPCASCKSSNPTSSIRTMTCLSPILTQG